MVQRPDGMKARCGGPGICIECAMEAAQKFDLPVHALAPAPVERQQGIGTTAIDYAIWRETHGPKSDAAQVVFLKDTVPRDAPHSHRLREEGMLKIETRALRILLAFVREGQAQKPLTLGGHPLFNEAIELLRDVGMLP